MAAQDRGDGHAIGYGEAARRWTSGDLNDRIWVESEAREFIGAQADHLLETPSLEGYREPTRTEFSSPAGFSEIEAIGESYQDQVVGLGEGVEFDDARHEQIQGTQYWTAQRHEMAVARMQGDTEELAQLRKFTTQARVQDSRDAEWDGFARSDPNEMPEKQADIWRKAKPMPGIGEPKADGAEQRWYEDRMPDEQTFGSPEHYSTGSDRLDSN